MIVFKNNSPEKPYLVFKDLYDKSKKAGQKSIEAICISSYSPMKKEIDSRYVNLKFIDNDKFIFFSNYDSPKAHDFKKHNQVAVVIYWNVLNVQIRLKAKIERTSSKLNKEYFSNRSLDKNALAISSQQSKEIDSFEEVKKKFHKTLQSSDLKSCPENWGGFCFIPYYFEFWKGHNSRLNQREVYQLNNDQWHHSFLQP